MQMRFGAYVVIVWFVCRLFLKWKFGNYKCCDKCDNNVIFTWPKTVTDLKKIVRIFRYIFGTTNDMILQYFSFVKI